MPVESDTAIRRRADAALRLPPLDCGCRDPESREHKAHDDDDQAGPVGAGCLLCTSWSLETIRYHAQEHGHCPCRPAVEATR